MIANPDLILVADETLLETPGAGVLNGQEGTSAVFVNAAHSEGLAERFSIAPQLVTLDITGLTLEMLGRASALSAGMGAAAAKLCGRVTEQQLVAALEAELEHLDVPAVEIQKKRFAGNESVRSTSHRHLYPARDRGARETARA